MQTVRSYPLKSVAAWLYACAAAVFIMAIIGAITRLTESGLSITRWEPITGTLPPLSDAAWQQAFDLYKQTPEFQQDHYWMALADFKKIYFWEWLHRLWGRMIGLVYALPFFYFLARKQLPAPLKKYFWMILALGAAQGFMGWFMVQSGLVERTDVSHYRLAAHLMLAFTIFACLLYLAFKISLPKGEALSGAYRRLQRLSFTALKMALVTMVYGAFVAGLKAGLIYNEFPLMGRFPWPTEGLDMTPVWINVFENHATVQFIHRMLAVTTFVTVIWMWVRATSLVLEPRLKRAVNMASGLVVLQAGLGIGTLLSGVNITLAVMHQGGAMCLLASLVWVRYELKGQYHV